MIMPWGVFRGMEIEEVTDSYLMRLTEDFDSDANLPPGRAFPFKVSYEIRMGAREELKKRGYMRRGKRWVKEDE